MRLKIIHSKQIIALYFFSLMSLFLIYDEMWHPNHIINIYILLKCIQEFAIFIPSNMSLLIPNARTLVVCVRIVAPHISPRATIVLLKLIPSLLMSISREKNFKLCHLNTWRSYRKRLMLKSRGSRILKKNILRE